LTLLRVYAKLEAAMHVISRKPIDDFIRKHADSRPSLETWWDTAEHVHWRHLEEVKANWPSAENVKGFTVFNVSGNKYRLITRIDYQHQRVYIRDVFTHAEYNRWRP
jgi:mRNA interferase HigB